MKIWQNKKSNLLQPHLYFKFIIIKFDFSWCQICSAVKFIAAILIVVAAIFNVAVAFLQLAAAGSSFGAAIYCDNWTPASVRARVYEIL